MSDIEQQLKEQIAEIDWQDLIPHAQKDSLILVHPDLDLIDVGLAIANDQTKIVQNWVGEQLLQKPTGQQLSQWNEQPTQKFRTIIVQPFVLVSICSSE